MSHACAGGPSTQSLLFGGVSGLLNRAVRARCSGWCAHERRAAKVARSKVECGSVELVSSRVGSRRCPEELQLRVAPRPASRAYVRVRPENSGHRGCLVDDVARRHRMLAWSVVDAPKRRHRTAESCQRRTNDARAVIAGDAVMIIVTTAGQEQRPHVLVVDAAG